VSRSALAASRIGCGRKGRASGRTDIGVERRSIGQKLRREPLIADTRTFSRVADTRWIVGAFTRIFLSAHERAAAHCTAWVVVADVVPLWAKRAHFTRPSLAKEASATAAKAQSAPQASI